MSTETTEQCCFNCAQSEATNPLISLRYAGRSIWICPGCMPVLIHNTGQLAEILDQSADSASRE